MNPMKPKGWLMQVHCMYCGDRFQRFKRAKSGGRRGTIARSSNSQTCSKKCALDLTGLRA